MKKYFLLIGGVLLFAVSLSGTTFAQTNNNQYPTKPADAATLSDIQGGVGGSYFQDNSLKQGAGNVSEGGGTGNLLKNTDGNQIVVVTGPVPTEDNAGKGQSSIPWVGLFIFALVIVAPLVIIFNMIKDIRAQAPATVESENDSSEIEEEILATDEESVVDTEEEVELVEEESVEENESEETEKPEEKPITATKSTAKKKSKKGKKKKRR